MKIEWNQAAFKDIRYGRTSEIIGELEKHGEHIRDAANVAGEGTYEMGSRAGTARPQGRHRVTVVTADYKSMRDNARNNTILRALG